MTFTLPQSLGEMASSLLLSCTGQPFEVLMLISGLKATARHYNYFMCGFKSPQVILVSVPLIVHVSLFLVISGTWGIFLSNLAVCLRISFILSSISMTVTIVGRGSSFTLIQSIILLKVQVQILSIVYAALCDPAPIYLSCVNLAFKFYTSAN